MKSLSIFLSVIVFLCSFSVSFANPANVSSDSFVRNYLDQLREIEESEHGELWCGTENMAYDSCDKFNGLIERGCYGTTTAAMHREARYKENCKNKNVLENSQTTGVLHFDLTSNNWWHDIPAEIIPVVGGVHNDESWERANNERDELVFGKTLGTLNLDNRTGEVGKIQFYLKTITSYCSDGNVFDVLDVQVLAAADFDNDGTDDLLIRGSRLLESDVCFLGSGASIGSSFLAIVFKNGPNATPKIEVL